MNDYQILLALNGLEIERHKRVIHALKEARRTKAALPYSVVVDLQAEIADRERLIRTLKARRDTFSAGALKRRRGQRPVRRVAAAYLNYG